MAISVLQRPAGFNTASANSDTQTLSGVTAGSLVIAVLRTGGTGTVTATCSDLTNGSWTAADHLGASTVGTGYVFYFLNSASGNLSVTVTLTGGPATIRWCFVEVSAGAGKTWDKLDQHLMASATSQNSFSSGNVTTTVNDEYALGEVCLNTGIATVTAGTGWTLRTQVATSKLSFEDQILTTTGTIHADGTLSSGDDYVCGVFTWSIKASGGGGRGLFQQTPMTGLGVGGSYFSNPIG